MIALLKMSWTVDLPQKMTSVLELGVIALCLVVLKESHEYSHEQLDRLHC